MTSVSAQTVTFLFTDIEGSTRVLQQLGDRYPSLLAEHHRLLREPFRASGGEEVDSAGDGLFYAFASARGALTAAVAAQRAITGHVWPDGVELRVRMGIHTGEAVSGEVGYVGLDVHRAARISAAGHGGQILISQTARDLTGDELPGDVRLLDLGEHRLKDLPSPEHLYQVLASGLTSDFPALRSIDARPNNLPRQLTSFIGRHNELAETKRIFSSAPLVTLTGPGGVGKTRLALELAADVLVEFADGAWFVDLGTLTDPAFVVQTVAAALGVVEQPGRPILASIAEHIQARRLLIVLDNCEHVLDASAEVANTLLLSCASLRIVATSREALGISGEAQFPVPSLSLPDPGQPSAVDDLSQYDSVRLFAERAMAASPSFRVTDRNARSIAQICRRLDGVPLAVELAAARVRALTVDQIAERLDDRFRLLTGSTRLKVPRHQTLRATIDWSYELLTEAERAVLRRLSVFAGGCALEAADAVCAGDPVAEFDVVDLLSRLVDKSLVGAEEAGGEGRYRLLETIRQYARDRLLESGEAETTLRRHRNWFAALAERAASGFFYGVESVVWLERLDREHDNLRAALQWSEDEPGEREAGLGLASKLWRFWEIRGHLTEGREWLERMLSATAEEVSAARAAALTGAGILAYMQGDSRAALTFHEESLALCERLGDPVGVSTALNNVANVLVAEGNLDRARELYEHHILLSEHHANGGTSFGHIQLADVLARQGDHAGARAHFEESLAIARGVDNRWSQAFAMDTFAQVATREADYELAQSLLDQALEIWREVGDERGVARTLTHLADVASRLGDAARARSLYLESVNIRQTIGDQPGLAAALETLAWAVMADDTLAAARLLGAAEVLRQTIRAPMPLAARAEYDQRLAELESRMGEEGLESARNDGRRMSPADALATIPL